MPRRSRRRSEQLRGMGGSKHGVEAGSYVYLGYSSTGSSINARRQLVEYECHRSIMSLLATSPQPPCITRSNSEPSCPVMLPWA